MMQGETNRHRKKNEPQKNKNTKNYRGTKKAARGDKSEEQCYKTCYPGNKELSILPLASTLSSSCSVILLVLFVSQAKGKG